MTPISQFRRQTIIVISISTLLFAQLGIAKDYRAPQHRATYSKTYQDSRVLRLATGLGRSTKALSSKKAAAVYDHLENKKKLPADVGYDWQKLLRMSQGLALLQSQGTYFPVGYEFEAFHKNKYSLDNFTEGFEEFEKLVGESFDVVNSNVYDEWQETPDWEELPEKPKFHGTIQTRGNKMRWKVVDEYTRPTKETQGSVDGFELVSPPIMAPEQLEHVASLVWRLGQSKFGHSNGMTGQHQTFSLTPIGTKATPNLTALTAANVMLLQAQFAPALFEILDVKRGGVHKNIFMRPLVFDHQEFLGRLAKLNPKTLTPKDIKKLRDEYSLREADLQLNNGACEGEEEKENRAKPDKLRAKIREAWKFRDLQLKFGKENPNFVLAETRIADYVADRPEQVVLTTVVYQMLIKKAYELAQAGQFWKLNVPARALNVADPNKGIDAYWSKFKASKSSTVEALAQAIGLEGELGKYVMGKSFEIQDPKPSSPADKRYYFEMEGGEKDIVDLLLPRDPKLRSQWNEMSTKAKVQVLQGMGYEFWAGFSQDNIRILTSEFYADTETKPFLSNEVQVETSGSHEIKTNTVGFKTREETKQAILKIFRESEGSLHIHRFEPSKNLSKITGENGKKFADLLERISLFMALKGYAETDRGVDGAYHGLDSWSLDRYSEKDLEKVSDYLEGKDPGMSWLDQKYHNVAFRPVKGGLDIEFRDIDDEYGYMFSMDKALDRAIQKGEFTPKGKESILSDEPIFMEFRDAKSAEAVKRYTIEDAVAQQYQLTASERDLLHKFQFEIYKPSMGNYLYFADFATVDEVNPSKMDTKYVRTNFENNLAFPLLNYEQQSFISKKDLATLAKEKKKFVDGVYKLLKEVESDKQYAFISKEKNFLHLCEYLQRSKHPSRPDFKKVSGEKAEEQREILENLVFELRALVVDFVQRSKVSDMVRKSF